METLVKWLGEDSVVVGFGALRQGQTVAVSPERAAELVKTGCWEAVQAAAQIPPVEQPAEPTPSLEGLRRKRKQ